MRDINPPVAVRLSEVPRARFLAGGVLGAVPLGASTSPARADIEDAAIPVDGKGKKGGDQRLRPRWVQRRQERQVLRGQDHVL